MPHPMPIIMRMMITNNVKSKIIMATNKCKRVVQIMVVVMG